MAEDLMPGERFREAGSRYMREQNDRLEKHLSGTLSGEDPEDLHDMRVASRRLRAAMLVFESCFDSGDFRRWYRRVTGITEALGAVRDLDVQLSAVTRRREGFSSEQQAEVDAWISSHHDRRDAAREAMRKSLVRWKEKRRSKSLDKVLRDMAGCPGADTRLRDVEEKLLASLEASHG